MATRAGTARGAGRIALLCAVVAGLFFGSGCTGLHSSRQASGSVVRGHLVGYSGPLANIPIHVAGTGLKTITGEAGAFELTAVPTGRHRLVLMRDGREYVYPIVVAQGGDLELGQIVIGGRFPAAGVDSTWAQLEGSTKSKLAALGRLAAGVGITHESWQQFLATGTLPELPDGMLSRRDLVRMVYAAAGEISRHEALAVLSALTGRPVDAVRGWLRSMRHRLPRMPREGVSTAFLSRALALMQSGDDFGDLEKFLLADRDGPSMTTEPDGRVMLFDGALRTLPGDQGWWYLALPWPPEILPRLGGNGMQMDTSAKQALYAGHFTQDPVAGRLMEHPAMPVLDRHEGFALTFDLMLRAETHTRDDRAGLSILVVCEDLKALELGFWEDRVWAQGDTTTPLFEGSRAETARHQVASKVTYELVVRGERYELYADGIPLLDGPLRDYSAWEQFPYTADGLVFIGDNTPSASARYELQHVAVQVGETAGPAAANRLGQRDAAALLASAVGCHPVTALKWLDEQHAVTTPHGALSYTRTMLAPVIRSMREAGIGRKGGQGVRGWVGGGVAGAGTRRADGDLNPHKGDVNKGAESVF